MMCSRTPLALAIALVVACCACGACGPKSPAIVTRIVTPDELPPPNPRVEPTEEDERACARLAAVGCSDAPKCLATIADARTDHIPVPSKCLAHAADLAAVRRCGDHGTLTFDCKPIPAP